MEKVQTRIYDKDVYEVIRKVKNSTEDSMKEAVLALLELCLDTRILLRKSYQTQIKKSGRRIVTDPTKARKGDVVVGKEEKMKKKILLFISLICFLVCCSIIGVKSYKVGIKIAKKQYRQTILNQSTVEIISVYPKGGLGFCSGVITKQEKDYMGILTAGHCVEPNTEIYVDGIKAPFAIKSPTDDLAYLIIPKTIENKYPIFLNEEIAKRREKLFYLGYPTTKRFESAGYVILTKEDEHLANLEVISGCSGGPIINKEGKLVGIVIASLIGDSITIYEPIDDIREFLEGKK